ncbi:hypothetical protein ACVBEH_07390 [Roseateles sp. GG27B]
MPVVSSRSPLREQRHPNSVTTPPIHRGSMPARPWRGFWNSVGTALLLPLTARRAATPTPACAAPAPAPAAWGEPWQEPWQAPGKRPPSADARCWWR